MVGEPSFLRRVALVALAVVATSLPATTGAHAQGRDVEWRTIDGSGNNPSNETMGTSGTNLMRLGKARYSGGATPVTDPTIPSARVISNRASAQVGTIPNTDAASDFMWQWGQFLDHDIVLTQAASPAEPMFITVPTGDPFFDPGGTGTVVMSMNRSAYDPGTGTKPKNPRQQVNTITTFIDASNVYGSDAGRAAALRTNDGTGRLASSSSGRYLPFNTAGLPNAGGTGSNLFLAGDVRANEQVYLTAMHTLFMREHNRLAREIAAADPTLTGDEVYERARKIVGAEMQVITYNEFLPVLLGPVALAPYTGYDPTVDATISNEFSVAAYRYGHSQLSSTLLRLDASLNETNNVPLRDAFFNPSLISVDGGLDTMMRGLANQLAQDIDTRLVDDVRNFLFGAPGQGGFDLASLNIERARDHGLPRLNDTRQAIGLPKLTSFSDLTSDPAIQAALAELYGNVGNVELWIGGLAEDHVAGALVGETFRTILIDQFTRLRDGDRFWYQNDVFFTSKPALMAGLQSTTLAALIRRNTRAGAELQDNVFLVP